MKILLIPVAIFVVLIVIYVFMFVVLKSVFGVLRFLRLVPRPVAEKDKSEVVLRGSRVDATKRKISHETKHGIRIGDIDIPVQAEGQHILFAGSTGTGKSQGISCILSTIRARNSRAMIIDASGDYLSKFYKDGDTIFNPLDQRSVRWSPFAEIQNDFDCNLIAKAVIPDTFGEAAEWHHYAQSLLGETMLKMHQIGIHSVKQLLYYVTAADRSELEDFLGDMPAATMCREGNERMLGSTRAIMASFLLAWRYLTDIRDILRKAMDAR